MLSAMPDIERSTCKWPERYTIDINILGRKEISGDNLREMYDMGVHILMISDIERSTCRWLERWT